MRDIINFKPEDADQKIGEYLAVSFKAFYENTEPDAPQTWQSLSFWIDSEMPYITYERKSRIRDQAARILGLAKPEPDSTCPECGGWSLHDGKTETGLPVYRCTTCDTSYSVRN
jgi:hypothetical protein